MHSRAQGSDADSTVPLYLPFTHWQLAEPVTLLKLCSRQDAHGSLLYPSLNVPLGHSVKEAANTYQSTHSACIAYHISPNQIQSRTVMVVDGFVYNTSEPSSCTPVQDCVQLQPHSVYSIQCTPAEPVIGLVECCHSAHTTTTYCP